VGSGDAAGQRPEPASGRLKIGLLGLGVVGRGVYQSLSSYPERFEITGIAVRDTGRPERAAFRHLLTSDPWSVIDSDADVVIELIGGHEPARELIASALRRSKHVVTANKLVVARHGEELSRLAAQHHGGLHFAAAVGGAVPMLEAVNRLRGGSRIESLHGVLNGTCNFVLDELAQGRAFPEAVEKAQTLGFAEADPTLDLDGTDTAHKLTLLARASGAELKIENIDRRGILELDSRRVHSLAASGKSVRLVASLASGPGGLRARVAPEVVDGSHPFARIRGEQNCLIARRADGSEQVLRGKGAGRWPTTVSVMSDVLALSHLPPRPAVPAEYLNRGGAA
jgi:homoserine dehydrogenase